MEALVRSEIQEYIKDYLEARKRLIEIGNKYPDLLSGNDNMISRIGEFYGLLFLQKIGQNPYKPESKSNQGYDFIDKETNVRTQIKVISCENKKGRTVRLKQPWDQLMLFTLSVIMRLIR